MKPALLFILAIVGLNTINYAQSQAPNYNPANQQRIFFGTDIQGVRSSDEWNRTEIKGTPFLIKEWATASITLKDNRIFQNISMRLNCVNNTLHYLNDKKEELIAPDGVIKEVLLIDSSGTAIREHKLVSGFPVIGKHNANTFYEQLVDGNVQLLCYTRKRMMETRTLGSAGPEKEYLSSEHYFVYKEGVMMEWEKGKDFLLELLSDKKEAVDGFIKSTGLKCRSVDDARKVISFYNHQF